MKPFNLEELIKKQNIRTREGLEVTNIVVDMRDCLITGKVMEPGWKDPLSLVWHLDGTYHYMKDEHPNDLFIEE